MARRTPAPVAGRYTLLDRIGEGGSGSVWRAWDTRQERVVAAKVLAAGDPTTLLRFVREQGVRVRHPHVLAPLGWAAEDDLAVLVTDLVRGGSLLDLLDSLPAPRVLPEGFAVALLDQVLQALAAVHAAGVVHGDVKPANVLMEPTGTGRPHARLADFGVATRRDGVVFDAGPVGTPGYLAPEVEAGAAPHPSQDVYALGRLGQRLLRGTGAASTLLAGMTRPEPGLRPTAAAALERLRVLPVRRGGSWPVVADRLGPDPRPPGRRSPGRPWGQGREPPVPRAEAL